MRERIGALIVALSVTLQLAPAWAGDGRYSAERRCVRAMIRDGGAVSTLKAKSIAACVGSGAGNCLAAESADLLAAVRRLTDD